VPIPAAAAATLALPFLEQAGRGALQLAQTPVLGWERAKHYTKGRKRPVEIWERSSFTLRAWELVALGVVGVAVVVVLQVQKTISEFEVPSPFNLIVR